MIFSVKDGSAHVRKAPGWKDIQLFDSTKKIESISLINEGKNILFTTKDSSVQLWDNSIPILGKPILNLLKAYLIKVADNGKWFIVQQEKIATIYKLNDKGSISHSIATPETGFDFYESQEGIDWNISPDGEWVYFATRADVYNNNGRMYNTSTGKVWHMTPSTDLKISNGSLQIFSPDSKYFSELPLIEIKAIMSNLTVSLKAYSLQNLNNKDSVLPQYGKTIKLNTSGINIDFCAYNSNIICINSDTSVIFFDIRKGKKMKEYNLDVSSSFLSDDGEKLYLLDRHANLISAYCGSGYARCTV